MCIRLIRPFAAVVFRPVSVCLFIVCGFLLAGGRLPAASFTWDGGGADNFWTTPQNWATDVAPPNDGTADLHFTGSTQTQPKADVAYRIRSLTLDVGAGSSSGFYLNGKTLTLGAGGLTQNGTNSQTLSHDSIVLAAPQTWTVAAGAGTLSVYNPINNGGYLLTPNPASGRTLGLTSISGAGGLTHAGAGTTGLSGVSTYTGPTTVTAGTLTVGGSLTGSSIAVAAGGALTNSGTVNLSGTLTLNGTAASPAVATANYYTLTEPQAFVGYSGTNTVAGVGIFNHGAASKGATHTVTDTLYLGYGALDSGTYNLTSGVVYAATQYVGFSGSGTVAASGGDDRVSGVLTIGFANGSSGTYTQSTTYTGIIALGGVVLGKNSGSSGTLSVTGSLETSQISRGAGTGTLNLNGTLIADTDNANFLTGLTAVNLQGASVVTNGHNITIAQPLLHAGTATTDNGLGKTGLGTLALSAAETYNGPTSVTGGTLLVTGSLNGTTGTALTIFNRGTFNSSQAAGRAQGMGALTFYAGEGTVQSTYPGSGTSSLTFSSLAARVAAATDNFVVSGGANGSTNQIKLTGTAAGFLNAGTFYGGGDYAWMSSAGGYVRAMGYNSDSGASSVAGGASLSGTHVQTTGNVTAQATTTLSTLKLSGVPNVTLASGATLTLGGLLKAGGATGGSTISGGTGLTAASGAELIIRTDKTTDALTISTPIIDASGGTNSLTKSGDGTLTFAGANTYTGVTNVNAGTLVFAPAGTMAGGNVYVAPGAAISINSTQLTLGGITVGNSQSSARFDAGPGSASLNGNLTAAGLAVLGAASTFVQNPGATLKTGSLAVASLTANTDPYTQAGGAPSTYTLAGGTISATTEAVGGEAINFYADGLFNHTGGTNTVSGLLTVSSYGSNTGGAYYLSGTDSVLSAQNVKVGIFGSGTISQSGGTVTISNVLTLADQGSSTNKALAIATYTLSGGALSAANERISNFGYAIFNHSGGTNTVSGQLSMCYADDGFGGAGAIGTYTLSGTGQLNTQSTVIAYNSPTTGTFIQNGGTHTVTSFLSVGFRTGSIGTYSLNGGVVQTPVVTGRGTFNFNGGILRAGGGSTSFMNLGTANVQAGGAKIDTAGYNVTVAQALLHDATLGTTVDGGLTKTGTGTLTLTGVNTYTGPTNINNGSLAVGAAGTLGGAGAVNIATGATLDVSAFGAAGYTLPAGRTVTNNGSVAGVLNVSGGDLQGSGSYGGGLAVSAGSVLNRTSGTLAVGGTFTNNGTVRFTKGSTLDLTGVTVINNNGTLDFLTGSLLLPPGVTINNGPNGRVLTSLLLGVDNNCAVSGSAVTVKADGYSGHVYQLQRAASLVSGFTAVAGVPVQNGMTGSDFKPTPLSFTDTNASAAGFYRVAVDP